ncbi:MAG: hypothetical protein JSS32_09165 [Verrucomicrobia bacterium]|nr:hypothetical protein [Verrucomicrobiota bacterium]
MTPSDGKIRISVSQTEDLVITVKNQHGTLLPQQALQKAQAEAIKALATRLFQSAPPNAILKYQFDTQAATFTTDNRDWNAIPDPETTSKVRQIADLAIPKRMVFEEKPSLFINTEPLDYSLTQAKRPAQAAPQSSLLSSYMASHKPAPSHDKSKHAKPRSEEEDDTASVASLELNYDREESDDESVIIHGSAASSPVSSRAGSPAPSDEDVDLAQDLESDSVLGSMTPRNHESVLKRTVDQQFNVEANRIFDGINTIADLRKLSEDQQAEKFRRLSALAAGLFMLPAHLASGNESKRICTGYLQSKFGDGINLYINKFL